MTATAATRHHATLNHASACRLCAAQFNVYFLTQIDPAKISSDPQEQWNLCMNTPGTIELTWNYGSETRDGKVYNTGNSDTTGTQDGQKVQGGFGHLGITVPDVYEAC